MTERFDTSTAFGRLFLQMQGSFGEFERDVITVRATEDRQRKAEDGGHACGEAPLGYRKNGEGKLEPDPETAPPVQRSFELRGDRGSLLSIAERLDAKSVDTKARDG